MRVASFIIRVLGAVVVVIVW